MKFYISDPPTGSQFGRSCIGSYLAVDNDVIKIVIFPAPPTGSKLGVVLT